MDEEVIRTVANGVGVNSRVIHFGRKPGRGGIPERLSSRRKRRGETGLVERVCVSECMFVFCMRERHLSVLRE